MDKPFSVRVDDFQKEIITVIEQSGIPPVVLRMILANVLKSISELEQKQLAEDRQKYEMLMQDNSKEE